MSTKSKTPTDKKPAAKNEKRAYVCNHQVHHDNQPYAVGDEIELTEKQAAALNAQRVVVSLSQDDA